MSIEIVYARACAYVRPRPTARLRMREIRIPHIFKCLRHLRRLFNARSKYFMRAGSHTETPREMLRKRKDSATGYLFQLSPREATRWLRQRSRSSLLLFALLCTVCLSLLCLPLRSRSPHNAQHFTTYWGECEPAPTLLMSMEIVYVRASTSDRHTSHARERCSNYADLAGFGAVCLWSRKCPKYSKKATVRRLRD